MSTPNDNRAGFGVEAKAGSLNQPVKGKIGQPRPAAQPSPAAVELALAEEKANQEKIKATVQAAKASATQPFAEADSLLFESGISLTNGGMEVTHEAFMAARDALRQAITLQAQRDELLAEAKCMLRELNNRGITCSKWDAAIARATEGGTGQ